LSHGWEGHDKLKVKVKCTLVEALRLCTGCTVQCTLVEALRLCTGHTANRGSRGTALPFHDHGTRRGEGSASLPGRSLPPGKGPVPIVQEAVWTPVPVWRGVENLATTGIRSRTVQPVASRCTDYATGPILTK
jgi:hypothetical protein